MGAWIFFFLVLIVAKDLSAMVGFITRFTEDAFATLVSVVFIIQAVEKIWAIQTVAPLTGEPEVKNAENFLKNIIILLSNVFVYFLNAVLNL